MDFSSPLSAMSAFESVTLGSVSNIANVNTDGYRALSVRLESGPEDRGVQIASVYREISPGPSVVYHVNEQNVRDNEDMAARNIKSHEESFAMAQANDVTRAVQEDRESAWYAQDMRIAQDHATRIHDMYVERSTTDLPREFANLIVTENAYSATAVVLRTMDEMTGSILNVRV